MTDGAVKKRIKKLTVMMVIVAALLLLSACQSAESQNTSAIIEDGTTQHLEKPETSDDMQEQTVTIEVLEDGEAMKDYDFSVFTNVEIAGIDISALNQKESSVLYRQAEYCQAMTDADIDKMREIVSEDMIFTHMSGRQQTREEYFADIADGSLRYFTIGIENPSITIDGDVAEITYASVLNANAYGARGTYRMTGTHRYEQRDGEWIAVNR